MFFKNIKAYQITREALVNSETLNEKLEAKSFNPCQPSQSISYGWTPPLGNKSDQMVHSIGNRQMICLRQEEKLLPPSVINEKLEEMLDGIEKAEGVRPFGKMKQEIKDNIILELLPKAFTTTKRTYAYIDLESQMIIVDSSSNNKAEELIETLRQTLGSLPVLPLRPKDSPSGIMTAWLNGHRINSDFTILGECELRENSEDGGIIRTKNEDLTSEEILAHLYAGMEVTKLSINWEDKINCVLHDDFSIKRIKFSDELIEQATSDEEDPLAQFEANFIIMSGTIAKFINRLIEVMGGEAEK